MTGKADFEPQEWEAVLEGPTSAGLIVMSAERGGSFREAFAMAKVFAEARGEHGESELLDEITAHRPKMDRTSAGSPEELREHALQRIGEAVALVERKGSQEELEQYRGFVETVARRVAEAKDEPSGEGPISESEKEAIASVESALRV
ncbi:MAG TPA: hypothetical protein VFN82_08735 [Solirubrobacterales bacterium]|nr:hypothetical protein [Solirubrobacterales bacterium]